MTEDEAKTKWCPRSREPIGHPHGRCIGSACMAWRTRHQWLDNAQEEPVWVSYHPYAFTPGPGQERDDGYCGVVGEPQ